MWNAISSDAAASYVVLSGMRTTKSTGRAMSSL